MERHPSGFRVAVFGPSGAGKTTSAWRLAAATPNLFWMEVSRDLIEGREMSVQLSFEDRTKRGIEYYERAVRAEGADWAAKRTIKIIKDKEFVLVTGIRGIENLRAMKAVGFFCIFLSCSPEVCAQRLVQREHISLRDAQLHSDREESAFHASRIEPECDFTIDTTTLSEREIEAKLFNLCLTVSRKRYIQLEGDYCERCALPRVIGSMFTVSRTQCNLCLNYSKYHNAANDQHILAEILSDCRDSRAKALLGFSGGKDSTAALQFLIAAKCDFQTFTVDMGYYPLTMLRRAEISAQAFGIEHNKIDGRQYVTRELYDSFEMTASLFDSIRRGCVGCPDELRTIYSLSREHYSAKDTSALEHPRVCVLCRKAVIRSYYGLAKQHGAKYIFLGINEWATLAASQSGKHQYSGVRKLSPEGDDRSVYVVHLPFMAGASLSRTTAVLAELGWSLPFGESLVETNSNSCLLAKASEIDFARCAGFHPDATRLAREVVVGFLQRAEAIHALSQLAISPWSVRSTLQYANILGS